MRNWPRGFEAFDLRPQVLFQQIDGVATSLSRATIDVDDEDISGAVMRKNHRRPQRRAGRMSPPVPVKTRIVAVPSRGLIGSTANS